MRFLSALMLIFLVWQVFWKIVNRLQESNLGAPSLGVSADHLTNIVALTTLWV